jgi:hypothetical protein
VIGKQLAAFVVLVAALFATGYVQLTDDRSE